MKAQGCASAGGLHSAFVRAIVYLPALILVGCGSPNCPPPDVKISGPTTLVVNEGGYATALLTFNGDTIPFLLDTGFDRSALEPSAGAGVDLAKVKLTVGRTVIGPTQFDPLLSPLGASVLGNDVLHQLPLVFDPAAGTVDIRSEFGAASEGAAPLTFIHSDACRNDDSAQGAAGPNAFLLPVNVEGQELTMLLDTGADVTFVRKSAFDALTGRDKLSSVKLGTAFAGNIFATATRAKTVSVGNAQVENLALFTATAADEELDARQKTYSDLCKCTQKVDGLLGWNFLREHQVSLAEGKSATDGRVLGLTRLATQDHWKREFVGIGAYFQPSQSPAGLKIDSFLSNSPARDAGLKVGDVITRVNGAPALSAPNPFAPPGTQVTLEAQRSGAPVTVSVTITDLLPNPP